MIDRIIENNIKSLLFKGKAILIFGPRQTGKTTLVNTIKDSFKGETLFLSGDEPDERVQLQNVTSTQLKEIIGNAKLLIIDEAQRIQNIGITLKLIVDKIKEVQVIATGSSAFELADKIKEPLTGRKYEFYLYPFSFSEMVSHKSVKEEHRLLENRLIYGCYPEVVTNPGNEKRLLTLIADSYLYRDIYKLEQVKKPAIIEKLIQALAFQVGNEVSYRELSSMVDADKETIERYIIYLERAFIIFRLQALSRNSRKEIKRGRKIYFWDNGIRNSIIRNFNPISLRNDVGALWENYLISERLKSNHYMERYANYWFWRTVAQQEIDYIEEMNGKMHAYEFKWSKEKTIIPQSFMQLYQGSDVNVINKNNYTDFLL